MSAAALPEPGLFVSRVMHMRLKPVRRQFAYRVFSLLADGDDPLRGFERVPFLSRNRFNVLSYHDADFGPRDGSPLRPWAEDMLRRAGIPAAIGALRLHFMPRLWGYAFNPLSILYVYAPDGRLSAIIHQVRNTFGETHSYAAPVSPCRAPDRAVEQEADKVFYVSPFIGMKARYRFALREPFDRLSIGIKEYGEDGHFLTAAQTGARQPATAWAFAKAIASNPLMTLKVIGGIHYEAARLWARGAAYHARPTPPDFPVSAGRDAAAVRPMSAPVPVLAEDRP
jgi:uncharacterized protein